MPIDEQQPKLCFWETLDGINDRGRMKCGRQVSLSGLNTVPVADREAWANEQGWTFEPKRATCPVCVAELAVDDACENVRKAPANDPRRTPGHRAAMQQGR